MVTLATILPTLNHNNWFAALDLQDPYFYIAILPSHRRFLRVVMAGRHHQYTVLPFGLSSSPWIFTKCVCHNNVSQKEGNSYLPVPE